jgi:hypothetical protein
VVEVDDAPAEVPDAFPEVRRSEVATEIAGGRAPLKEVEFVTVDRTTPSVTTSACSNLG